MGCYGLVSPDMSVNTDDMGVDSKAGRVMPKGTPGSLHNPLAHVAYLPHTLHFNIPQSVAHEQCGYALL